MNNRRAFIKKGALAGLMLAGTTGAGNQLLARAKGENWGKTPSADGGNARRSIRFNTGQNPENLILKAINIFYRILTERTGIDFSQKSDHALDINLIIVSQSMPGEGFRIDKSDERSLSVLAGDANGILYGLGKLLHTAQLTDAGFIPGSWTGLSVPEKPRRNIYFATHFHNFYHTAPVEKVTKYIEELALWGYNNLEVWFDMHGFNGINDPRAVTMLDRLAMILRSGKEAGMKISIVMLANEGYHSSPVELRAKPPKQIRLRGCYGVEICPSQPGGTELILKQVGEELDAFQKRGLEPDFLGLWPYDQGGCGCDRCTPWGSNGYLKLSRKIAALARNKVPGIQLILSTWLFDCVEDEGEWAGLAKAFKQEKPWVDYIQADSHEAFPQYLMNHAVPGDLPLLNFPEISMWGSSPWGGFGANPLPGRFQKLWDEVKDKVAGGAPYSEGIFEDINKVIYSRFYWSADKTALEAIREYVSFEFSADHADTIIEAIMILEKNHGLQAVYERGKPLRISVPAVDYGAKKALQLLTTADRQLNDRTKKGWRWRILLLRALFDVHLRQHKGIPDEAVKAGFLELSRLYYAELAEDPVRPPVA